MRLVTGDFNVGRTALDAFRVWRLHSWEELQVLMNKRYNVQIRFTCKSSTTPDQIWLSPEAQQLVCNVGYLDCFPDHLVLAVKLSFPSALEKQLHWRIPAKLPWDAVEELRSVMSGD